MFKNPWVWWRLMDWGIGLRWVRERLVIVSAIAAAIIIILMLLFSGDKTDVDSDDRIGELTDENLRLQQAYDSAKLDAQTAQSQLAVCSAEIIAVTDLANKTANQSKFIIKSLGTDIANLKSDLERCEDAQDAVIADAARRLCCMQRVDNPAIDSYSVSDDRIVCATGGQKAIRC
jgi:hypothetical protein